MRFTLIDRITAIVPGESISAVKQLSLAEEYLADHFPGFPVMPGVLMLEALVQTSAWYMRHTEGFAYITVLVHQVRAVKFVNFVAPGRTLSVRSECQGWNGARCTFKGSGSVDGAPAVSARLTLERFNLADKNPELTSADARQIDAARELFGQLWPEGRPKADSAGPAAP
jgi:3-hydroxyacyl-[acyl-carrier-protein] dehydratase